MAPVKPKGAANKKARKSATAGPSKSVQKNAKRTLPTKQVKTKPAASTLTPAQIKKKRAPKYTDAQLNLPAVNSIVPASATAAQRSGKSMGKKKNKIYVDDQESMMTILAMVNAEKEGAIESKMMRERQMEEIREARRKESEKRAEFKKDKLEEVKKGLKSKGKRGDKHADDTSAGKGSRNNKTVNTSSDTIKKPKRKSVSFA